MDICLEHSGIGFEKKLYSDDGEDKEYVLNAKYRLPQYSKAISFKRTYEDAE